MRGRKKAEPRAQGAAPAPAAGSRANPRDDHGVTASNVREEWDAVELDRGEDDNGVTDENVRAEWDSIGTAKGRAASGGTHDTTSAE